MIDLAVIMSIYHRDRLPFVKESVESILNQTFHDFQYYLIFDGPVSDDVQQYVTTLKDNRIRLYRLEQNKGLAVALNTLLDIILKNPEYKFIVRMDADDVSLKERFEKQRQYLISNPETTVLGTWYEEIDESGKHLAFIKLPCDHEKLKNRFLVRTPFAHPSVMFKRRLFEIAGCYPVDANLMEDNFLWGKALSNNLIFANLAEVLLKFRIDRGFFNRRSGFRYGFNYIRTKFRINRMLGVSPLYYLISFCLGIFRMLPPFVFRSVRQYVYIS